MCVCVCAWVCGCVRVCVCVRVGACVRACVRVAEHCYDDVNVSECLRKCSLRFAQSHMPRCALLRVEHPTVTRTTIGNWKVFQYKDTIQ